MRREWKLLLAFIGGAVFAELGSDPTDYLFFHLYDKLTAEQAAAMWYYLTAAFYAALFLITYLVARLGVVKPEHIVYIMVGATVFGAFLSWRALAQHGVSADKLILILGIPLVVSLAILNGVRREI